MHNKESKIERKKNTDFVLTDFTTITKPELADDKAEHQLNFVSLAW